MNDAERITGLTKDTIRNWCKEFNIQVDKTEGGHRRFTEESLQVLKAIQEKKLVNNWSMKQIGSWLNGELTPEVMAGTEVKTNLEKKFENLEDVILKQNEQIQMQNQLFKAVLERMDDQEKRHQQQLLEQEARIVAAVEKRLADPIEKRTLELTNSLNAALEVRQNEVAAAKEKEAAEKEQSQSNGFLNKIKGWFKA